MIIETANVELIRRLRDAGYAVFRIDAENLLFLPVACNFDPVPFEKAFGSVSV